MKAATERILVLGTPDQKARIAKKAKAANMNVGGFVRRAAEAYQPDDEEVLERLIEQIKSTATKASKALDASLAFVAVKAAAAAAEVSARTLYKWLAR